MQTSRYQKWNWQHKVTEDQGNDRRVCKDLREKGRRRGQPLNIQGNVCSGNKMHEGLKHR